MSNLDTPVNAPEDCPICGKVGTSSVWLTTWSCPECKDFLKGLKDKREQK